MIQPFYLWVYTPKNGKWSLNGTSVHPCHSSIISNIQKVEASQISITREIYKENVVYKYNGILFTITQ